MAYGKFKMVMNPKGAEEARRKQEKEKRNPNKDKKKAPIVKFGSAGRAKPGKRYTSEGGEAVRYIMPLGKGEISKPKGEKRPLPKPGKTLIDTIKGEKRPLPRPLTPGGDKKGPGRRTIRPPKAGDRRMRGGK